MELKLPSAQEKYDFSNEAQLRRAIEQFARKPLALYSEDRVAGGVIESKLDGDVNATGGYRQTEHGWKVDTTIAANQPETAMTDEGATRGRIMVRAGSITGLALRVTTAQSAGLLAVRAQKSTDDGVTWNTIVGCEVLLQTAVKSMQATFLKDLYTFAAGNMLRLIWATTSGWLPTANNVDAAMELET